MPAEDRFANAGGLPYGSLEGGFAITPNDTTDLPYITRELSAVGAGDIAVVWKSGLQTVEPVAAGERLAWRIVRVKSTGTTATGIKGYF